MLKEFLLQNRPDILHRWQDLILSTYHKDASRFLRNEKDRFLNPVGFTISNQVSLFYDRFVDESDSAQLSEALGEIVQIRVVQEFKPSEALSFIPLFKNAVRSSLGGHEGNDVTENELLELEKRVDTVLLLAFDCYMKFKERICDIRVAEVQNRTKKLLERMNVFEEEAAGEGPRGGQV